MTEQGKEFDARRNAGLSADLQSAASKASPSHTPGPWTCRESAMSYMGDLWFVEGPRPEEADMHGEARAPRVAEVRIGANARLIAAAPDLFAAVKEAEEFLDSHGTPEQTELLTMLRAAIAKAEGKETDDATQ